MPNEKSSEGIHVYDDDTKQHMTITPEDLIHIVEHRAAALKKLGDA